jgi:RNA polymerase sigma-70 factor, ECF subfamily
MRPERVDPEIEQANNTADWLVQLFEVNANAVFDLAYRMVWDRSEAQSIAQQAFLLASVSRRKLTDLVKARRWLLAFTYREALMQLRGRRLKPPARDEPGEGAWPETVSPTRANPDEIAAMFRFTVDQLPDSLRPAFVLSDIVGLSIEDIAHVLGVDEAASKMRVSRARARLQTALTGKLSHFIR